MKRPVLILFAIVLLGCGKDSDPGSSAKILGTWSKVSSTTFMSVGNVSYGVYLLQLLNSEEELQAAQECRATVESAISYTRIFEEMDIKSDGSFSALNEVILTPAGGTWKISPDGDTLAITSNSDENTQLLAITNLNDSELSFETGQLVSPLPDGAPKDFSYTATVKYKMK